MGGEAKRRKAWVAAGGEDWGPKHHVRSGSNGRGHQPYPGSTCSIDPWDVLSHAGETPPPSEPAQPPLPNVTRIDCGREPARPSLSAIRARKRAA